MSSLRLQSERLDLVLPSVEEALAGIEAMSPEEKAYVSDEWLARVRNATEPDPWIHGFKMICRENEGVVGECGFKGPPNSEGVVEIAYAVHPDQQGRGYATEAAAAMVTYALSQSDVHLVCAHTLREPNASTRVLTKCGFQHIGEVIDPDDGPVWRWEKPRQSS